MRHLNPSDTRHFLDIPLANGLAHGYAAASAARSFSRAPPPPALHLSTTRGESTRVQLQKQRLQEQHHAVVVSQRIPGFKTSAAFFASLRTNLHLVASPPPSPLPTPPSMRASTGSLPPPSPLSFAMDAPPEQDEKTRDPMAGVPELKTYTAESEDDKIEALRLVADSVAQMRQSANSAILWHPLSLAVLVAVMVLLAKYLIEVQKRDLIMVAMSCTGLTMMILIFCRWLTQPYIEFAEQIDFDWLGDASVLVTKFGDEIIGTAIIDWVTSGENRQKRKKPQRGEIKGWTVRLKYRGKGVGAALLDTAVQEARKKGVETLEFAEDHANSRRVLPGLFNGKFDNDENRSRNRLQDLLETSPARRKR